MNKKISFPIALIIIIVLAFLAGGLAWQFGGVSEVGPQLPLPTPTPDETADWRIYRGGSSGYESEIKYPKDWMIDLNSPILSFRPEVPRLPEHVVITMGIQLLQSGVFSLDDFLENPKEVYINNNKWYYKDKRFYHEDLKTALTTRTYISPNFDSSKVVTLQLIIRGGRQTRDYYLPDSEIENELKILNQMAYTFKFLEKIEAEEKMICPEGFVLKGGGGEPSKTLNNEVVCIGMYVSECLKCGDGICDTREDWCICPEDCQKPNPESLELYQPF